MPWEKPDDIVKCIEKVQENLQQVKETHEKGEMKTTRLVVRGNEDIKKEGSGLYLYSSI